MKIKSGIAVLISIGMLLASCLGSTIIYAAVEDKEGVIESNTKAEGDSLSKYLGVWYDKASVESGQAEESNPNVKIVIRGISDNKLLFSICQQYCMLDLAIAEKQADGSYQFTYDEVNKEDFILCDYGTECTGKFTFDEMELTAVIDGSTTEGIGYTGEFVYYSSLFENDVQCNLVDLMTDYKTAHSKEPGVSLIEDKDSGLVAEATLAVSSGFDTEECCYNVEGITIGSFQEDCVARFGQPVSSQINGDYTEVVYLVDEKYYFTSLLNRYGAMKSIKLRYANEEEVLGFKIVGDYKIQGTKIVEYIGGYDTTKTVTIPKGITEISENAFSIDDDLIFTNQIKNLQIVSLCIPKDVKIDEYAFRETGPMNITFEEGRTKIEKRAFSGCSNLIGLCNGSIEITLPSSIKSIEEGSFATSFCSDVTLNLNEGLEVIGDYALSGTKCKLPSTVKKLGDYALSDWWYDSDAEGELSGGYVVLPEGLEEIGDHCIYLELPTKKITIPASVKKMGKCPISYGENAYRGGVLVEEGNRYYKSDQNGWLYTKSGKTLLYAACFKDNLVVPEGVEYVAEGSLNLDKNGEGGIQKIILPKSLKKYNQRAASYCSVVFKGNPPKLVGTKEGGYLHMTFYVPKSKLKAYKTTFQSWESDCTIIGQ